MKKMVITFVLGLVLAAGPVLAHHPAENIVDAEVYAMINEMVLDTPHATMVFNENMGQMDQTIITVPSVSDAEDMIDDYLLAVLSLLEDVTITITFGEYVELEASGNSDQSDNWTERDYWGRQVIITVDTLLCEPYSADGCIDITED